MTVLTRSLRFAEAEAIGYRRTWRGTVISSFVNPILYLAAMGAGLGSLVDSNTDELGIPYLTLVATGMLAATAMQAAATDGSFPVMAGILWRKNYYATITTPVSAAEITYGRLLWGAVRLAFTLGLFAVIAVGFGAIELGPALLSVLPGILVGIAFLSAITAFTVTRKDSQGLTGMFRFAIIPLFLFSGTFFPISRLPEAFQTVAVATPLFHGVELVRKVALPDMGTEVVTSMPIWIHAAYLIAMTLVGVISSARLLDRRLRP